MRCTGCMQVGESLAQLLDITKAFEESYNEASAGRSSEAEFAPVLAAAVDPLVETCERSADSLQPDAPSRCAFRHAAALFTVCFPCNEVKRLKIITWTIYHRYCYVWARHFVCCWLIDLPPLMSIRALCH